MRGIGSISARYIFRACIIAAFTALLMWSAIGVTMNFVVGSRQPETVMGWWPFGSLARASGAGNLLGNREMASVRKAEELAAEALGRDPLSIPAARNLALSKAKLGDLASADKTFQYAHRISRRDLATELWLIERAVEEEKIEEALDHYDHALRTSREAMSILFPILVAAASDQEIANQLSELFRRKPPWMNNFFLYGAREGQDTVALTRIMRSSRSSMATSTERVIVAALIARLVKDGNFREAQALYADNVGSEQRDNLLIDAARENSAFPPFDWTLRNEFSLHARFREDGSGRRRLNLYAGGERGGWLARRLLVLAPGRYRLTATGSSSSRTILSAPRIAVRCSDREETIGEVAISADRPRQFDMNFSVLPQCEAQWLEIFAAPATNTEAWLSSLSVHPLDSRPGG